MNIIQIQQYQQKDISYNSDQISLETIKSLISVKLNQTSIQLILILINQALQQFGQNWLVQKIGQWKILFKDKFNTNQRIKLLKDKNHRKLIIKFLQHSQIRYYKHSYFNRSKLDEQHLKYLEILKPANFTQVLMLVNKLKIIHKFFYHILKEQVHQSQIDYRIVKILETCNVKERAVNSSLKKFLMIVQVQDQDFRTCLIKELGKLLRECFKRDKLSRNQKQREQKEKIQKMDDQQQQQDYEIDIEEKQEAKLQKSKQIQLYVQSKIKQKQIIYNDLIIPLDNQSQQRSLPQYLKSKSAQSIFNPFNQEYERSLNNDEQDFY